MLVVDDPLLEARCRRAPRGSVARRSVADRRARLGGVLSPRPILPPGNEASLPIRLRQSAGPRKTRAPPCTSWGCRSSRKSRAGFAGLGVRLVANTATSSTPRSPRSTEPLRWSRKRFIEGPIGNPVALFDRGLPICWMSAFKVRTWPGPFGPSSARQFMSHADVEPLIRAVGARSGITASARSTGLDAQDRLQIIELNARPGADHPHGPARRRRLLARRARAPRRQPHVQRRDRARAAWCRCFPRTYGAQRRRIRCRWRAGCRGRAASPTCRGTIRRFCSIICGASRRGPRATRASASAH